MDSTVKIITVIDSLHHQYSGQQQPQDIVVDLDLETGDLYMHYNSEIGNGVPMAVFNRRTIRWGVGGCPTIDEANRLLKAIEGSAQAILDGAEVVWDGHNYVGRLNEHAREQEEGIERTLDDVWASEEHWDAADWLCEGDPLVEGNTTDEEIAKIAAEVVAEALRDNKYLSEEDCVSFLQGQRDDLAATPREINSTDEAEEAESLFAVVDDEGDVSAVLAAYSAEPSDYEMRLCCSPGETWVALDGTKPVRAGDRLEVDEDGNGSLA